MWDVNNDRKCLRTFLGHAGAVRDICFSHDGRTFLSASYDRYIRLWDTETGKVINTFTTKKYPYVAKFHPDEDKQNEFVVGGSDKKINQVTDAVPVPVPVLISYPCPYRPCRYHTVESRVT